MVATVVIGMSGGVDSSVAALLLKQQGYHVIGMFMKNWEETRGGKCQSTHDFEDVVRVCELIGIPYYSVNFTKQYLEKVFSQFIEEFKRGQTPNPDILCNKEIKFKVMLEKALDLGGDYLATGHYCQIGQNGSESQLLKGSDPNKDQSYFLYTIQGSFLNKILFPIGSMSKNQVRNIARENNLPTAEKKDSTGICFIGKRDFKTFLSQYIPITSGNFETSEGKVVGRHDGFPFYTIGQRRGLGIGGPGEAWYVVGKDVSRNVVIVEQGENHSALFTNQLTAVEISWVSSRGEPPLPFHCTSKIRYRQPDHPCVIRKIDQGQAIVDFPSPQRAVTPRQSIVFYSEKVCLGGGIIVN
jgi:tRNA-specific 2-thiouridylase